jgi:hypothetical protein
MPRARKKLPRKGLQIIADCASRGVKETDLAKALGMSHSTWRNIRENDPIVKEAYEAAKSIEHDQIFGKLYEKALNGDTVACIFLLKTRHHYREQAEIPTAPNVTINLPGSMSPEQYAKLINIQQSQLNKLTEK